MKAMILAAGRGERLKPLTLKTPKPLLPVGDTTLLGHVLSQVRKAGITDVVINVHHLGDQIIQYSGDGSAFGLKIQYSVEDTLLETGGGIFQALPLLGSNPFLVLSADVWTDYPLEQLITKKTNGAHLVFVDNPDFHPAGDYALDQAGFVHTDLPNKLTYANVGLLHPDLFCEEKSGVFRLSSVFQKAIMNKQVTGERYAGVWYNVGTQEELNNLIGQV
jgi:MurNAc alpha-1-phosphate uridylyltransferase